MDAERIAQIRGRLEASERTLTVLNDSFRADIRVLVVDNETLRDLALRQHEMLDAATTAPGIIQKNSPYHKDYAALLEEGRKTLGVE